MLITKIKTQSADEQELNIEQIPSVYCEDETSWNTLIISIN